MSRASSVVAWGLAALGLAGVAVYVALDKEHTTLDEGARVGATSRFVRLHDGVTEYEVSGPDTGRTVVLLSGATVPYYLWDPTRAALAGSGFHVLRYNYYGRGLSDRPKLRYDLA